MNKYGRMHEEHLKKYLPEMYRDLKLQGEQKFREYLDEVSEEAVDMMSNMMANMEAKNPLPKPFFERVDRIEQDRRTAEEIVLHDLILLAP